MAASAKVYVGNLSWNTNDDGLAHAFSAYGQLTDYVSSRLRGSFLPMLTLRAYVDRLS